MFWAGSTWAFLPLETFFQVETFQKMSACPSEMLEEWKYVRTH